MACDEALVRINSISPCWPKARTTVSQILTDVVKGLCSSKCIRTVAANTARHNFANFGWGSAAWRPDETDCPILYIIEGNNIWWAYNSASNDLGTVPAVAGTGTAWKTMDADYTTFTPAIPANWSPAPTTVADALDQIVNTNPVGGFIKCIAGPSYATNPAGQALTSNAVITVDLAITSENTIAGSTVNLTTNRITLPVGNFRLSYYAQASFSVLGDGNDWYWVAYKLKNVTTGVDVPASVRYAWGFPHNSVSLNESFFSVTNSAHIYELQVTTPSSCTGNINAIDLIIRQI